MIMKTSTVSFVLAAATAASARTFTVKNNCDYTVWPAVFTGTGSVKPDGPTGWEAPKGHVHTFKVDEGWTAGRVWGRTGCDFSTNPGPNSCATGGCNGWLECDGTGSGVPPASLAEWSLSTPDGNDWYDVSLVDGANIPISITNNKQCHEATCPKDVNPDCPAELALVVDGKKVGCKTACSANLDGNPQDSANCCSGSHSTPDTCLPDGVEYYHYFKDACPNSYVYAYDESSHTALWTCEASLKADYTVTFCP